MRLLRKLRPVSWLFFALASLAVCVGCGTSVVMDETGLLGEQGVATTPGFSDEFAGPALGVVQPNATGFLWVGYNMFTNESGDLSLYDAGDGSGFGLGFGNGEDVKNFFELAYEKSVNHQILDAGGNVIGDVEHERAYLGRRRYILPVAGRAGRLGPFLSLGLFISSMVNSGPGGTPETDLNTIQGFGLYFGTGIEVYLGGSNDFSLSLDMRGAYWTWEGSPFGTGRQGTVAATASLVYHF